MNGLNSLSVLINKVFTAHKRKGLPTELEHIRAIIHTSLHQPEHLSTEEAYQQIQAIAKSAHYDKALSPKDIVLPFLYHLLADNAITDIKRCLDSKLFEQCLLIIKQASLGKTYNLSQLNYWMQELAFTHQIGFLALRELCFVARIPLALPSEAPHPLHSELQKDLALAM